VFGKADAVDVGARVVHWTGPEGHGGDLRYDRLVLAAGSVNRLLPIPGVAENAHGFRSIAEALHLRDHIIRQLELADDAADQAEREARCTFVVVGAGYTGTEVAAQGQLLSHDVLRRRPRLEGTRARWMLLDTADRVLPGLNEQLSRTTDRVLRRRGIDVRLGTSVTEATADGVQLTDGSFVPSRTLVWCVGVQPDPLAQETGLPLRELRLEVDEFLAVPGHPEILSCGDAAAAPDPANPGRPTAMTAQHAVRQGALVAHNIAASFGVGERKPYRHKSLGFVVDLGGWEAAADPLGVPLSGLLARTVTRGYHLWSLPANRVLTASEWLATAVTSRPQVQFGLVAGPESHLDTASR
jgi:NADH dehydrogenase